METLERARAAALASATAAAAERQAAERGWAQERDTLQRGVLKLERELAAVVQECAGTAVKRSRNRVYVQIFKFASQYNVNRILRLSLALELCMRCNL